MDPLLFQPVLKTSKKSATLLTISGVLLVLCTILYMTYPGPQESVALTQYTLELQEFSGFMKSHGKRYSSQEEFEYRFQVFRDNSAVIRAHNSLQTSVVLAANKFADLTSAEFKELYTQKIPQTAKDIELENPIPVNNVGAIPTAYDWRDQGAVTDVPNQGPMCKASWAFAVAAAVEGIAQINGKNHILYDLSVQEIIDCQTTTGSSGCNGGNETVAYNFVQNSGLTADYIYPYIGTSQSCNTVAVNNSFVNISSSTTVPRVNGVTLPTLISVQPVVAVVEADQYVWQFYQTGIINNFCGTNVNHFVLIVGYDLNNAFYTVKNSWGNTWGESGYVRIGYGTGGGLGTCGIQTRVSYPNL